MYACACVCVFKAACSYSCATILVRVFKIILNMRRHSDYPYPLTAQTEAHTGMLGPVLHSVLLDCIQTESLPAAVHVHPDRILALYECLQYCVIFITRRSSRSWTHLSRRTSRTGRTAGPGLVSAPSYFDRRSSASQHDPINPCDTHPRAVPLSSAHARAPLTRLTRAHLHAHKIRK